MKLGDLKKLASMADGQNPDQLPELLRQLGLDPTRLYQELEMTSRYADSHRDTGSSNAQVQLHSHTFFELIYCCNTCGAEYLIGPDRYRLQRGDVIFLPPGVSHRPLLPEDMSEPYNRYVLWLSHEFMNHYAHTFSYAFNNDQLSIGLLRTAGTKWENLGELFRGCVTEAEEQADGWESVLFGNAMILLTQIKRAKEERSVQAMRAEKPELLDKLMAHIESNYASHINITDLAKTLYVSSSTVSHLFKEKTGVSFYRYVTQRRLIAAKTLIEKGSPLEEAGLQSGFTDYSSFYRAFKQEFGIAPRQYRILLDCDARSLR